ncbi:putative nuclease HARBI1 [Amphiura filiformis]|uniref:putative nuclease HARBI1 n=1 Tax=Amphiura filiformis TaxID=82378 RepID=UPI003B225BC7
MAGYRLLLFENRRARRRERVFRDRLNPFDEYDNVDMYKRYRFTRLGCQHIIDLLQDELQPDTLRNHSIPPSLQVFIALRFYARGKVIDSSGDKHNVSIPTTSRVIRRVTLALCRRVNDYVKFPTTPQAVATAQQDFMNIAGFPRILGAVDCTHVELHGCPWGPDEYIFVNRKNRHSINVQLICNAHYKITNVVARWPGSTHDSRILRRSRIGMSFENGDIQQGILLGDSGYTLRPWMMSRILNPANAPEEAYNRYVCMFSKVNNTTIALTEYLFMQ